jgi:hypothetical protein
MLFCRCCDRLYLSQIFTGIRTCLWHDLMVEKASCCPLICTHDYICFASANEILADALQAEV